MNMKYTWHGQIFSVLLTHIELAFMAFIIWLLTINITATKVGGAVFTAIAMLFYILSLYNMGYTVERNDNKSYTKLNPVAYKGLILPVGIVAVNILVIILYKLAWSLGSDGESLITIPAVIANVFGIYWTAPFMSIIGMDKGAISAIGYAVIFIIPIVSCALGYYAGYKNFDISAKFNFLVYEKKKK